MYLKRLELAGFKSFAKETIFEFLTPITAVVGPNGSGKSNVVEAVRWVMGEQSMKSLRGKRGGDFIFGGTPRAPRLSRASVSLTLDNAKKQLPVEFDEVVITRRVTRDGTNQYHLNNSQVRLKDIVELLSHVGLGVTQHHIISQGEADRVLIASLDERRAMVEEALGLKGYHIKREEAERKLTRTEEHLREVSLLQKEIKPHLKYLHEQAEKMKAAESHRTNLNEMFQEYVGRELATLHDMERSAHAKKSPLTEKQKHILQKMKVISDRIVTSDKSRPFADTSAFDTEIDRIEEELRGAERELARLQVRSEIAAATAVVEEIDITSATEMVSRVISHIERAEVIEDVRSMRSAMQQVRKDLEALLKKWKGGAETVKAANSGAEINKIEESIVALITHRTGVRIKKQEAITASQETLVSLRTDEHELRALERDASEIARSLADLTFEEERIRTRTKEAEELQEEYRRLFNSTITYTGRALFETDHERETVRRKLERARIKVEEAGAVDASVLNEYKDVMDRDQFLEAESKDIITAMESLRTLVDELTDKLENEFTDGVSKINAEFQKYFVDMFGGGQAEIFVSEPKKKKKIKDDELDEEEEEQQSGVDIKVTIPGKRIHALDMLSGGERALTSIALLFAMSSVNPPPFLILDETDAALDEANSRRYAAMLGRLANGTQLIVVTHNRETMRAAGVLYGVTLAAEGYSRLLSLKFEEALEVAK